MKPLGSLPKVDAEAILLALVPLVRFPFLPLVDWLCDPKSIALPTCFDNLSAGDPEVTFISDVSFVSLLKDLTFFFFFLSSPPPLVMLKLQDFLLLFAQVFVRMP